MEFYYLRLHGGESSKSRPFFSVGLGVLFHFFLGKVGTSMSSSFLGETCHIFFLDFILSSFIETYFASILWTSCSASSYFGLVAAL